MKKIIVSFIIMVALNYTNHSYTAPLSDEINGKAYTRSSVCGECHIKIYETWKRSLHAYAVKDPVFQTAILQALSIVTRKEVMKCLSCHAPAGVYGVKNEAEIELMAEEVLEGVTCDYCHSTTGEDPKKLPSLKSSPTVTKYGPFKGLESPVHKVAYSPFLKSAEFCKGCHEYWNGNAGLLTTYSEWKASKYSKEGKQCQDCHMPYVEGELVDPAVKKSKTMINLHAPPGGRSVEQLRKAATVSILSKRREGDRCVVEVKVENSGAGHKLPTGIPSRYILLEFLAETQDGKMIFSDNYKFLKVVGNEKGEQLLKDYEIMTLGKKILSDNRLAPGESIVIPFSFYAPEDNVRLKVSLSYVYEPFVITRETMKVEIGVIDERLR